MAELDLGEVAWIGVIGLREDITRGQIVESHAIEVLDAGDWRVVAAGTTIGYRRLHCVPMVAARRVRVRIRTLGAPRTVDVYLYRG